MRLKNRYILGYLFPRVKKQINKNLILTSIKNKCLLEYGQYGKFILEIDFKIKYFNELTNLFIIKMNNKSLNIFKQLIADKLMIEKINYKFKLLRISSTINKCLYLAITYNKEKIEKLKLKYDITDDMIKNNINEEYIINNLYF